MEVERDLVARIIRDPRHVPVLRPALARLPGRRGILEVRIETAARHDHPNPFVEYGGVDRIVPAERRAEGGEAAALHERQRLQDVERPDVVPDRLHRAAHVPERLQVGIVLDADARSAAESKRRIRRRNRDVPARDERLGVVLVAAEVRTGRRIRMPVTTRAHQAKDAGPQPGPRCQRVLGNEEMRRHARARFSLVGDPPADVGAEVFFLLDADVERHALLRAGQRSHHLLHAGENLRPPAMPIGKGPDRRDLALLVAKLQQVLPVEPRHRLRREDGPGEGAQGYDKKHSHIMVL